MEYPIGPTCKILTFRAHTVDCKARLGDMRSYTMDQMNVLLVPVTWCQYSRNNSINHLHIILWTMCPCRQLYITLHCPRVHSNELGFFIPPVCWGHLSSLSSTFILIGHFLVDAYFRNEGVGRKISSFQQNLRRSNGHKAEVIKLGQLEKILYSKFGWWDGCRPSIKIHRHVQKWETYMWEFEFWILMFIYHF